MRALAVVPLLWCAFWDVHALHSPAMMLRSHRLETRRSRVLVQRGNSGTADGRSAEDVVAHVLDAFRAEDDDDGWQFSNTQMEVAGRNEQGVTGVACPSWRRSQTPEARAG